MHLLAQYLFTYAIHIVDFFILYRYADKMLVYSLFSGMTVIANFLLMITWLPACVVVSEHCKLAALSPVITKRIIRPLRVFGNKMTVGFTAILTEIVISLRFLWLFSLGIMAIASCIIVFRNPGLQLPDNIDFQLFDNTHPFEQYDLIYSRRFWFERYEMVCKFYLQCFCNLYRTT